MEFIEEAANQGEPYLYDSTNGEVYAEKLKNQRIALLEKTTPPMGGNLRVTITFDRGFRYFAQKCRVDSCGLYHLISLDAQKPSPHINSLSYHQTKEVPQVRLGPGLFKNDIFKSN